MHKRIGNRNPGKCDGPVCGADGIEHPRVRPQRRKLETVLGTVSVKRSGYGQEGVESLHPLLELNLPDERYSRSWGRASVYI